MSQKPRPHSSPPLELFSHHLASNHNATEIRHRAQLLKKISELRFDRVVILWGVIKAWEFEDDGDVGNSFETCVVEDIAGEEFQQILRIALDHIE
jgi:hypothetical protein